MSKESEIQDAIREALGRVPDLAHWRNSVGVAREYNPKTHVERVIRYGLAPGSPDIVGLLSIEHAGHTFGQWFCLEVKRPGEQPTELQRKWAAIARSRGAFVAPVTSVAEATAALERARNGGRE